MVRISVIMYTNDTIHSRFLVKRAIVLFPQISLHAAEPSPAEGLRGQLCALHSLPKLNNIPHRIDIFPK